MRHDVRIHLPKLAAVHASKDDFGDQRAQGPHHLAQPELHDLGESPGLGDSQLQDAADGLVPKMRPDVGKYAAQYVGAVAITLGRADRTLANASSAGESMAASSSFSLLG